MKRILLALIVFMMILSSCYTHKQAVKAMDSWWFHTKHELISQWGAPDQVFSTGDEEILVYYGNTTHSQSYFTGVVSSGTCKVQFFFNNQGQIIHVKADNCANKYLFQRKHRYN